MSFLRIKLVCSLALLGFTASCAAPRTPTYIHPDIESAALSKLVVLPVVDRRSDRSIAIELDSDLREAASGVLRGKGYHVEPNSPPGVEAEQVATMGEDELRNLIPPGADGVVVIYLDELSHWEGFQFLMPVSIDTVELTAWIVTPEYIIWEDTYRSERRVAGFVNIILDDVINGILSEFFSDPNWALPLFEALPEGS